MSRLARELFRRNVGPCVMGPDECEGRVEAHHVVTRQTLRKHGLEIEEWNVDNRMGLCERHHDRHHARSQPVQMELVPGVAVDFAFELGLEWWLERYYPADEAAA